MPLPSGTRYRWTTTKSGKKIRLAFAKNSNKVMEVKKKGGEAHDLRSMANARIKGK